MSARRDANRTSKEYPVSDENVLCPEQSKNDRIFKYSQKTTGFSKAGYPTDSEARFQNPTHGRGQFVRIIVSAMDVEVGSPVVDDELEKVLFVGREYTKQGAVIGNCLFLFGSNEGNCALCTKPCLHPLASKDLVAFFHVVVHMKRNTVERRDHGV